jgi:RHS repeat-associated protein
MYDGAAQHVPQHYKFTGKERDLETCATGSCLDNFGARFDASSLARFMTPDWAEKPTAVPYAHFGNPQSLNLYSYVENNPTTVGDPDGHAPWGWAGGSSCPFATAEQCQANKQEQWSQQWQANAQKVAAQAQTQKKVRAPLANCDGCTKDQAAIRAETKALKMTRDALAAGTREEFFGLVLYSKQSHSYTYTEPITFGDSGYSYPNSIKVPAGYLLSADYHTHAHVDVAEGEGFSCCQGGDAGHATFFNRIGYVVDAISGNLYRFTPGVTADNGPTETTGDFVTHIP